MDGTETRCADLNAAHRSDNPMGYEDDAAAQDADLHVESPASSPMVNRTQRHHARDIA
jgi:hypothetical protein